MPSVKGIKVREKTSGVGTTTTAITGEIMEAAKEYPKGMEEDHFGDTAKYATCGAIHSANVQMKGKKVLPAEMNSWHRIRIEIAAR